MNSGGKEWEEERRVLGIYVKESAKDTCEKVAVIYFTLEERYIFVPWFKFSNLMFWHRQL